MAVLLTMDDLALRLMALNPDLDSLDHFRVEWDPTAEDEDGNPTKPALVKWDPPDGRPLPTVEELEAVDVATAGASIYAQRAYAEAVRAVTTKGAESIWARAAFREVREESEFNPIVAATPDERRTELATRVLAKLAEWRDNGEMAAP